MIGAGNHTMQAYENVMAGRPVWIFGRRYVPEPPEPAYAPRPIPSVLLDLVADDG